MTVLESVSVMLHECMRVLCEPALGVRRHGYDVRFDVTRVSTG